MTDPRPEPVERLTLVLDVSARSLASLIGRPNQPPPSIRTSGRRLLEAAMLAGSAARALDSPGTAARRALSAIAGHLDAAVRHPETITMLRRLPRLAAGPIGLVHAFLAEVGATDEAFHHEVVTALRSPSSRIGEKLPFRELESDWVRWKVLPEAPEPASRLSASALIVGRPHPLYMTQDDLDAVTHGLWYLTDFGRLPPAGIDAVELADLIDQMTAWQANRQAAGQVAELLAARVVLGQPPSSHVEAAGRLVDEDWADLVPRLNGAVKPSVVHDATVHGLLSALQISAGSTGATTSVRSADGDAAFRFDGALIRAARRYDRAEAARLVAVASAEPQLARRSLALPEIRSFLRHQPPFGEEHPPVESAPGTVAADQLRATVREVYDRAAPAYGRHAPTAFSRFGELLVAHADLAAGMRVLDVGTGRGAALWPALDVVGPGGHVVGVDLSPEMVRHLADDLARERAVNAEAHVMDAENLAFEAQSFDAVLCSQALPFFPDPARALAEMFRVLRPGGVVGVATKAAFDRRWSWDSRLLAAYPHAQVRLVAVPFATSSQLGEALTSAGFVDYTAALEETEILFEDLEEYWGYVWSTGLRASLDRLAPAELEAYRRSCDAELRRMAEGGGIRQRYQVLLAAARRPSTVSGASTPGSTVLTRAQT